MATQFRAAALLAASALVLSASIARADDPVPAAFAAPVKLTAGQTPVGLLVADVDGDGRPDVVSADHATPFVVKVRLGDGSGTTFTTAGFTASAAPDDVVAADFDGDGKIDLAVLAGGDLVLAKNMGKDGGGVLQFTQSSPFTSGMAGLGLHAAAVGDVDHDGKPDVVASAYVLDDFDKPSTGYVVVFRNDGAGGFDAPWRVSVSDAPTRVAVGDLDGDGRADAVVGHSTTTGVSVLLAPTDGTAHLEAATFYALTRGVSSVAIADVTGDGRPDVVALGYAFDGASGKNDTAVVPMRNVQEVGGRFGALHVETSIRVATLSGLGPIAVPGDVVVADLNDDGKPEFVVADYIQASATAVYFDAAQVAGSFDHFTPLFQVAHPAGAAPSRVVVADLNPGTGAGHDAFIDVVTANANAGGVNVLMNSGGGGVTPSGPPKLSITATVDSSNTMADGLTHAFDVLTYTLHYANDGGAAHGVVVGATIPKNTKLLPLTDHRSKLTWKIGDVPAGGTGTKTFQVGVKPTAKLQDPLKLTTYSITGTKVKSYAGQQVVLYVANPLSLEIAHAPNNAAPGDSITYTLIFRNRSSQTASDVRVVDAVPVLTRFQSAFFLDAGGAVTASPIANPNGGLNPEFLPGRNDVTWYLGDVPAGGERRVQITVGVQWDVLPTGFVYNDAFSASTDFEDVTSVIPYVPLVSIKGIEQTHTPLVAGAGHGPNVAMLTAIEGDETTTVGGREIPTAQPGSDVKFQYWYFNSGDGDAHSMRLFDYLPVGTTFVAGSLVVDGTPYAGVAPTQAPSKKLGTLVELDLATVQHGTLPSGTATLVEFEAHVGEKSKTKTTLGPGGPTDWHPELRSGDLGAPVEGSRMPAIAVVDPVTFDIDTKTPFLVGGAAEGQDVVYQVVFTNDGGVAASDVVVTDAVPPGTTFQSARFVDGPAGTLTLLPAGKPTRTVKWNVGTLGAGLTGVVEMTVRVDTPLAKALAKPDSLVENKATIDGRFAKRKAALVATKGTTPGTTAAPSKSDVLFTPLIGPGRAKLAIVRIAPQQVAKGGELTYLIGYANLSDVEATNVKVAMQVPYQTALKSGSITNAGALKGNKKAGTGIVEWSIPSVAPHAGGVMQFTVIVAKDFGPCSTTDHSCYIAADNAPGVVPGHVSTSVRDGNFVVAAFESLNCFLADLGQRLAGVHTRELDADMSKSGPDSFAGGLGLGDAFETNGSYIVPLGDGGYMVFGRASNIVAQGGGNIVAQGGGNIVAQGGGNIVAQGGGNITVNAGSLGSLDAGALLADAANIVAQGGGNIFVNGGQNLVAIDGLHAAHLVNNLTNVAGGPSIISTNGGGIISTNGTGIVAAGAGNIVAAGAGNIVAQGGGNLISQDGGSILSTSQGNLISQDGAGLVGNSGGTLK